MPQMMPMLWLLMMIFTFMIFITFINHMYFFSLPWNKFMITNSYSYFIYWSWKW